MRSRINLLEGLECRRLLAQVGYWNFDEGAGTVANDLSGAGNVGSIVNTPVWTTGKFGSALSFSGLATANRVVVPDANSLDLTTNLTLSAWIQPTVKATQTIIKKGRTGQSSGNVDGYELSLTSGGKVFVRFNNLTALDTLRADSTVDYPVDGVTWMHVAATYDGATIKIYCNGVLSGSTAATTPVATNTKGLGIGASADNDQRFNGKIDDVRVYDEALTAAQIQALANNGPPTVNAGADQSVNLPSTITLTGTASDDGLPNPPGALTTTWSKVSGPGTVTFGNASALSTTAGFSLGGTYILRLTAFDGAATTTDDMQVSVNGPPVVNAGTTQLISWPTNQVTLAGSVTDEGLPNPPGAVTSGWAKLSGPGTVTFGNAASPTSTAMFSVPGVYVLRLTGNDGMSAVTSDVQIVVNNPPQVNAGPDRSIGSTSSAAPLAGSVTDDGLPNPPNATTTLWSAVSGPGTVTFGNASSLTTLATFSVGGVYTLRLTASDGAATASDDMVVNVNLPPVVNAGADQVITLPTTAANIDGTITDDGLPNPPGVVTQVWSVVSGPGTVNFGNATQLHTTAAFGAPGVYVLRLTANDNALTASDDVTIVVNQKPVPDAGPDQTISIDNLATLSATATDDGLPNPPGALSYTWSKFSGPGTAFFGDPNNPNTQVLFSAGGTYVLRVTVSDGASSASDDMTIFVNQPPVVNAGPDQTINLPSLTANLHGTVTDDGLPNPPGTVTHVWSLLSGPGDAVFGDPNALDTTVTFSVPGSYILKLAADDGSGEVFDAVKIDTNAPPAVDAGPDQYVPTPTTVASLDGTVTDDGLPNPPGALTTLWEEVSGPGTVSFGNANLIDTSASFSIGGTYVLRLTANDGGPTAVADTMTIVVNAAPVVDAGPDQVLPNFANPATLHGVASDDGNPNPPGSFTTAWTLVSGPGTVQFADATNLDTTATFSAGGTYTLRLTANDGAVTTTDDVVIRCNIPPLVNAGSDQSIQLPANVTLTGTASDDGTGSPLGFLGTQWSFVSGPGTVTFGTPAALTTTASFSAPGTYTLRLTGNDGLAAASDDVVVVVTPANQFVTSTPFTIAQDTSDKPMSKVWSFNNTWWMVMPKSDGTWVWRLDNTTWTAVLKISTATNLRADCKVVGNVTHVLLANTGGTDSLPTLLGVQLVSIQFVAGGLGTYQLWPTRTSTVTVPIDAGGESCTLDIDGNGRMWVLQDTPSTIEVRWADAPYSTFSSPITVASGVTDDDLGAVVAMPGKIGVLYSNQTTKRFEFRTHTDGAPPGTWSATETAAGQSANDTLGAGMADDHLNVKVGADGTVYAAVKTSFNTVGAITIGLLVRRPNGTWDPMYPIDTTNQGTRPQLLVNDIAGRIWVFYSRGNNIAYRSTLTSSIAFSAEGNLLTLSGINDASTSKQNPTGEMVVIAAKPAGSLVSARMNFDFTPPTVLNSAYSFVQAAHALTFQFSENILASLSNADLILTNTSTGQTVPVANIAMAWNAATNTATFTFPGYASGTLPDGRYVATIDPPGVADAAGNMLTGNTGRNFLFMAGDADNSGTIDLTDFTFLASNFNQTGRTFAQGDFNYDGVVDLTDFTILASKFNTTLAGDTVASIAAASRTSGSDAEDVAFVQSPLPAAGVFADGQGLLQPYKPAPADPARPAALFSDARVTYAAQIVDSGGALPDSSDAPT